MATNYCHQCGNEVSRDDRYCPGCGADLEGASAAAVVTDKSTARAQRFPLPLLIVALAGVLLILAGLLLGGGDEEGTSLAQATVTPGAAPIPFPDARRISLADARSLFDAGDAVFVDVRAAEDYAESHIPGAVSVPLDDDDLSPAYEELDEEAQLITYCT